MPGKPNTLLETNMPKPSAAPNDRTTVPTSTAGATSERSSTARIRNTTTSVIGMIT